MTTTALSTLIVSQSKTAIYEKALRLAVSVGLPVSTWHPGDPTRSQYLLESEVLSILEPIVANYIKAGFIEIIAEAAAAGDAEANTWLKIRAQQDFNVTVPEATYATTDVVMTNSGGGRYPIEPGDLTFKSSTTDKTYRNTTGGLIASGAGSTLTVTVVAEEPGSDSSAGAGEIDEMVTTRTGVTCSNPTAAVGIDEQSPATTVAQCKDKLDALSPNGPGGIYSYVARNSDLTGTNAVTRARVFDDSDSGDVIVYLAGASGGVSSDVRDLVEAAILVWATALCITPTVLSANTVAVPVTYSLWLYKSVNKTAEEIEEEVEAALEQLFATREIGGDIVPPATTGKLYTSLIESTIRGLYPGTAFRVEVTLPATDTDLENDEVATLGAVTATINLVPGPK